jgi:hypothetical protein
MARALRGSTDGWLVRMVPRRGCPARCADSQARALELLGKRRKVSAPLAYKTERKPMRGSALKQKVDNRLAHTGKAEE